MAGPATPTRRPPSGERTAELRRRREERRRQIRRRRLTLAGVVGGLVLLVVIVVAVTSGGGDSSSSSPSASSSAHPKAKAGANARAKSSGSAAGGPATTAEYRRESRAISKVLAYTPYISRGSPAKKEVALTIDDGPGPLTPRFVSTLRSLHAAATFFVVGQQLNTFDRGLRDAIRNGFAVGDHTEQHQNLPTLPASGQNKAIQDAALRIRSYGIPYPRLFRPPYGAFNGQTISTLHGHRMLAVLWTVDTGDFSLPGTQAIVQRAVDGAKNGAIILLHDGGGDRSQTLAALPEIVHRLRARGFQLVTVPQMLLHDPPSRRQARPASGGA
ncbi:MAG TPA: polysaccharide deacetylase family protein [Solirubrobacteraceae bacterium]|nr:polysaccharide deacetylase family protein [Solirubrobacteraceae bacterium]